jgi:hypothetical protein
MSKATNNETHAHILLIVVVLLGLSAAHAAYLGGTNVAVLDNSTNPTNHDLFVCAAANLTK